MTDHSLAPLHCADCKLAWKPGHLCPPAPDLIDVEQVIYALERAAEALDAQADRLHDQLDYSAEFPAEDAERMREAIVLLRAKPVGSAR